MLALFFFQIKSNGNRWLKICLSFNRKKWTGLIVFAKPGRLTGKTTGTQQFLIGSSWTCDQRVSVCRLLQSFYFRPTIKVLQLYTNGGLPSRPLYVRHIWRVIESYPWATQREQQPCSSQNSLLIVQKFLIFVFYKDSDDQGDALSWTPIRRYDFDWTDDDDARVI